MRLRRVHRRRLEHVCGWVQVWRSHLVFARFGPRNVAVGWNHHRSLRRNKCLSNRDGRIPRDLYLCMLGRNRISDAPPDNESDNESDSAVVAAAVCLRMFPVHRRSLEHGGRWTHLRRSHLLGEGFESRNPAGGGNHHRSLRPSRCVLVRDGAIPGCVHVLLRGRTIGLIIPIRFDSIRFDSFHSNTR